MYLIEQKVEDFIRQKNLLPGCLRILLAISGGADSVALLYIFNKLRPNAIHIAHINHQLRGIESIKDEEYVKGLANKLKLTITVESVDVKTFARQNKLSIETAARKLRLDVLRRIAEENNCPLIATAHQKNDNAETIIHRMLRGTGYKGLAGIRPKSIIEGKIFIRPLLNLTRREIENYLTEKNISWQNDHTNLDCRFKRNLIRHKIIPYLEKTSPNLIDLVDELSQHCEILTENIERDTEAIKQSCIISQGEDQLTIDQKKFLSLSQPIQVELIQRLLESLGIGLQKYTSEHYRKIIEFVKTAQSGKTLTTPLKVKITKGYDKFLITFPKPELNIEQKEVILNVQGETIFEKYKIKTEILDDFKAENLKNKKDKFTEWFDYENIKFPLIARHRRKGDKFIPFGLDKPKKIGKFLTSEKIEQNLRNKSFLISDLEKVLWLVPIRRAGSAAIDIKSLKVLKITVLQY